MLRFLNRHQIDDRAWDRCVSEAHNALVYGHAWYLDAVTSLPEWRWEGLVISTIPEPTASNVPATEHYAAVLPIPLRRRWGRWVVYQPLFCQFLAIFSKQPIDPAPFLQAVYTRYRHASRWHLLLQAPCGGLPDQVRQQVMYTHVLRLGEGAGAYTADRRMNLRRAARDITDVPDWQVIESADVEPLLTLFQKNHADEIGVGAWAYALFRNLFAGIQQRNLGTLQYAWTGGRMVAGALFIEQHGRIIYLFNAANAEGRRLNARSILIDGVIEKKRSDVANGLLINPLLMDFESPEKPGVVAFYESFGAVAQPYVAFTWSRLTWLERLGRRVLKRLLFLKGQRVFQS